MNSVSGFRTLNTDAVNWMAGNLQRLNVISVLVLTVSVAGPGIFIDRGNVLLSHHVGFAWILGNNVVMNYDLDFSRPWQ